MKILALADEEVSSLWDYYSPEKLRGYDLILSSGDLKAEYLSFLVTMANIPVLYVHGNHDTDYDRMPPGGCDCIDDKIVVYRGLRILGLGGCRQYCPGPYQYTEAQMRQRIRRLRYRLWRAGGVDIVVTHAPPSGFGDMEDPAHQGFAALLDLLEQYQPAYLLHGHVHMRCNPQMQREHRYGQTRIINVCPRYTLELPDKPYPPEHKHRMIWK